MKCPKCNTENSDSKKFCRECGSGLPLLCTNCGAGILAQDKFCGECGQELTGEDVHKKGEPRIEKERKNVTVLFSDLSGYTAMTERLDPEEVNDIMSRIFGEIAQVIAKYEGFIERFLGDAVMVLFGVPKAHEDDPVRAIRAAKEIHAVVAALSPQFEEKIGRSLAMHTGINTGLVVTDEVNPQRGTHGITGDPINLASRLVDLAQAGEILIGERTFKQAEGFFIYESLEPRRVKGKIGLINIYRVGGTSKRRTRFDVSSEGGLTPLVGRGRELSQLLEAFNRTREGEGQAFSIVSEAGVGKSRLLYEFRKAIARENRTFLEGKCLSYGKGAAYHPIIDMLKDNFNVREGDKDSAIRRKVEKRLKTLAADEASILPYILELLSVKNSGMEKISVTPEARKDRIIKALSEIAVRSSKIRPLVMAIEDLHWMDESSQDALKELLEALSRARMLMIFTYRPEFIPSWELTPYHRQVSLNRFSRHESIEMASHLLGGAGLDRNLADFILEKTEGIPLFIEEFVKSFRDLGIIEGTDQYYLTKDVQELFIPSTIQDVIMARVDTMPKGTKEVLQIGSAIEKEFSHDLIARVTDIPERELRSRLSALKDFELIYERGIYPHSTYVFRHALTRQVVYDSILRKKKKRLHEKIGHALMDLHGDNLGDYYGVLAEHFIAGGNYEKGAEYSKLAGKGAQRECSYSDAIEYCKKGISCLEKLPLTEKVQQQMIDARTTLAGYYNTLALYPEAYEAIVSIADTAEKLNYKKSFPKIYNTMGLYSLWVEEDHPKGYRYLNRVLEFPSDPGNYFFVWMANYHLGWHLSWDCEFEKGLVHFNNCIRMSAEIMDPVGLCWAKGTMSAMNLALQGRIDQAYTISNEALLLSEGCGDIFAQINTFTSQGLSYYLKGLFNEAETHLLMGEGMCERSKQLSWWAWTSGFLGDLYSDMGACKKAEEYYRKAIDIMHRAQLIPSWVNTWEISIAKQKALSGSKEANQERLIECYEANNLKICDGRNARHLGEIFMHNGEPRLDTAEDWIQKAIESDKKNGARWLLARDYALYAELLKRKGDASGARESMKKAIEIYGECGADGWVKKTEGELEKYQ